MEICRPIGKWGIVIIMTFFSDFFFKKWGGFFNLTGLGKKKCLSGG